MICPACGLESPSSAESCDCGYEFTGDNPQPINQPKKRINEKRDRKLVRLAQSMGVFDLLLLIALVISSILKPNISLDDVASAIIISLLVAVVPLIIGHRWGEAIGFVAATSFLLLVWSAMLLFFWWLVFMFRGDFHGVL